MWSCLCESFWPSSARLLSVTAPKNEDFQVGLRWGAGEDQAVFRLIGSASFPCCGFLATLQEIKTGHPVLGRFYPSGFAVWVTWMQECCKDGCLLLIWFIPSPAQSKLPATLWALKFILSSPGCCCMCNSGL